MIPLYVTILRFPVISHRCIKPEVQLLNPSQEKAFWKNCAVCEKYVSVPSLASLLAVGLTSSMPCTGVNASDDANPLVEPDDASCRFCSFAETRILPPRCPAVSIPTPSRPSELV